MRASDALVTTGTKSPPAILGAWAIAGENHDAQPGGESGVVEGLVELVHGLGSKSVTHLGSVECDPRNRPISTLVIGHITQVSKTLDAVPHGRVEELGGG